MLGQIFEQSSAAVKEILGRSKLDMAAVLDTVETFIPALLQDRNNWKSMFIDYLPPHLMRIHQQLDNVRVNLHYFLPVSQIGATATDAKDINLYHPHPWAAGFRILEGRYGQHFGVATELGTKNPPARGPLILQDSDKANRYVMQNPLLWHQVIPFADGKPVSTLMVTHIPDNWGQRIPPPAAKQRALKPDEVDFMFNHFAQFYPAPGSPAAKSRLGTNTERPAIRPA